MKTHMITWAVFVLAVLPLAAQQVPHSIANSSSQITEGKRIFEMSCSVGYCHGLEGRAGKGPRLRDRVWSRSYLYHTVEKGIPNSSMPAWEGRLTSQSIEAVVSYILSISQEQSVPENERNKSLTENNQLPPGKDIDLGRELFFDPLKDRNCGVCHRIAGSGTPVAPDLPKVSGLSEQVLLMKITEQPTSSELVGVKFKDGDTLCGIKAANPDGLLHIYDLPDTGPLVLRTIDRSSIAAEGTCSNLNVHQTVPRDYSAEELIRIVAFLRSLR